LKNCRKKQYRHFNLIKGDTKHFVSSIRVITCIVLLLLSAKAYTQDAETDSLLQVVTKGKDDSLKVKALISLTMANAQSSPGKALEYASNARDIATKIDFKSGEAYAYKWLGIVYNYKGNYYEALVNSNKSLNMFEALGDKIGTSNMFNNLGSLYENNDEHSKAVEYYIRSLDFARQSNNKLRIGTALGNIGVVYSKDTATNDTALNYYFRALPYLLDAQNSESTGILYTNIGEVYASKKDFNKAYDYYNKAIQILGISSNAAYAYNDLGKLYKQKQSYDSASIYFDKAYTIARQIDSPIDELQSLIGKGQLQIVLGKMSEAIILLKKALETGKPIEAAPELKAIYEGLSVAYEGLGDYKNALLSQNSLNDLYSTINERKLSFNTANLEYAMELQKQSGKIAMLIQQNKQQGINLENEKFARNVAFSALGVLLLVTIILLLNIKQRIKLNRLLSIQKRQIEIQKTHVEKALADLKATQSQLIHSEKMASLGELTAGIAHEIQNPLNFVNNFSELNQELLEELANELNADNKAEALLVANDVKENEQKIMHHGKRAESIVKGMLQHSRANTGKKEPTDINALVDESLRLCYHGLRAKDKAFNVTINTKFDEHVGEMNIISQDLSRVVLNLINNAFYAVSEKKKQLNGAFEPTISVFTVLENKNICIRVKDNGYGIPQNIADKIFQPFFTTKPTGQGTGLGLSLSYDIIKAHGGEIKVESKEGEGAIFTIQLPIT
jgi:two-component system NtrC family sensor kinase